MPDEPSDEARRAARLERAMRRFAEFGAEYTSLPLYSAISRHVARDPEMAELVLAAGPGQARPVLWLAALHELVLRRPDVAAARWYPSVVGRDRAPTGDPWPDVRRTVLEHRAELERCMATHATQTNEVNRCVHLGVGLLASTVDVPDRPVALVELGASAGLLLGIDRYAVSLVGTDRSVTFGDPGSPVRCAGADRAGVGRQIEAADLALPRVGARLGLDLSPVDLADEDAVRWLEACLWPEVPGRVERFRAARGLLRSDPPLVLAGDMVDGAGRALATARDLAGSEAHVVVLSSWALSYVAPDRRPELVSTLSELARDLPALSWLTAEPPGAVPGIALPPGVAEDGSDTVVGLRRWRRGRELEPVTLGTCHPHGAWVDLSLEGLTERPSPRS